MVTEQAPNVVRVATEAEGTAYQELNKNEPDEIPTDQKDKMRKSKKIRERNTQESAQICQLAGRQAGRGWVY